MQDKSCRGASPKQFPGFSRGNYRSAEDKLQNPAHFIKGLKMGEKFAHSHTALYSESKEHIQGKAEFNILSRIQHFIIRCFG